MIYVSFKVVVSIANLLKVPSCKNHRCAMNGGHAVVPALSFEFCKSESSLALISNSATIPSRVVRVDE